MLCVNCALFTHSSLDLKLISLFSSHFDTPDVVVVVAFIVVVVVVVGLMKHFKFIWRAQNVLEMLSSYARSPLAPTRFSTGIVHSMLLLFTVQS